MRTLKLSTIIGATMMSTLVAVPFAPPVASEVMIGIGFSGVILSALSVAAQVEYDHRRQNFAFAFNDMQTAFLSRLIPTLKTSESKDLCLYLIARINWDDFHYHLGEFTPLFKGKVLELLQEKELITPADCKAEITRIYHNQPSHRAIVQSLFQRYESDKA